jgi:hypothetical protein
MATFVTRTNTLLSRMSQAQKRIGLKLERGLMAGGRLLLEESLKLVPLDVLALRDSGRVTKIGTLFQTVVVVGFGGKDFPPRTEFSQKEGKVVTRIPHDYAVYVHENKLKNHDVGQADYLREPRYTKLSEIIAAINKELR